MTIKRELERRNTIYRAALEVCRAYEAIEEASKTGDVDRMFAVMWDLAWVRLHDLEKFRKV
jgi:hypothetical protein